MRQTVTHPSSCVDTHKMPSRMTGRLVRTQCARPARAGRLALGTSVARVPKPGVTVRKLRESDRRPITSGWRRNPSVHADCGALRSVLTSRLPCRRSRVRVPSSALTKPLLARGFRRLRRERAERRGNKMATLALESDALAAPPQSPEHSPSRARTLPATAPSQASRCRLKPWSSPPYLPLNAVLVCDGCAIADCC